MYIVCISDSWYLRSFYPATNSATITLTTSLVTAMRFADRDGAMNCITALGIADVADPWKLGDGA